MYMDIGLTLDLKPFYYTYTSHTNLIQDLRTAKTARENCKNPWKSVRSRTILETLSDKKKNGVHCKSS